MPDDDYEDMTLACSCARCSEINDKIEKSKQINALLDKIDKQVGSGNANVTWNVLPRIIKILKIMNDIE